MIQPSPVPHGVRVAVLLLAAATFVAGLVIGNGLFEHHSANNDEAVYTFQAKVIADGRLTLPAEAHADFFRPWMSGIDDDRLVLVFQPVFPATLALSDLLFGTTRVAVALIAAGCVLSIFAFARTVTASDRIALGSAAVLALSPLTLVHSGLILAYLYAMLLALGVLTLVLRASWGHRHARLVGAGLLHGLLFFMRPLDALILGVVVIVLEVAPRPSSWRPPAAAIGTVALAAVPGVLLTLAYNRVVTGHYLQFPLWAIGGENNLGFGTRFIVAGAPSFEFGPNDAWIAIRQNLRSFPHWLAGGVLAVPVGAYGLWTLRRARAFPALVALAVVVPLAYFFYWGNVLIVFGRRTIGPHYYLALLIPAAIAVAAGVDALARRGRVIAVAVIAALVVSTVVEVPDKLDRNLAVADRHREEYDAIHDAVGDREAVVVLPISPDGPYVLHPRGWLMNEPDLSDRVLFAADRLGGNMALFERFPEREIWRFQSVELPDGRRRADMARLNRMPIDRTRRLPVTFRNTQGTPVVVAKLTVGGQSRFCVLTREGRTGDETTLPLLLDASSVTFACPGAPVQLPLPEGAFTVAIGAAFGPNEDTGFSRVHEYRLWGRRGADATEAITPAEEWKREPTPRFRWCVTDDDPSVDLSLG